MKLEIYSAMAGITVLLVAGVTSSQANESELARPGGLTIVQGANHD